MISCKALEEMRGLARKVPRGSSCRQIAALGSQCAGRQRMATCRQAAESINNNSHKKYYYPPRPHLCAASSLSSLQHSPSPSTVPPPPRPMARRVLAATALLLAASHAFAQNLTDDQVSAVRDKLAGAAKQSWELGTRAQALTELDTPSFSALSANVWIPPPQTAPGSLSEVLDIAKAVVGNRSVSNKAITGPQPLVGNSAAGDPPSIGVSVLLANWTGRGAQDGLDYAGAAQEQLEFLFTQVPHTDDGAISHRVEKLQLWSDFVYMVPPFLAYYGVLTQNQSLVEQGYTQIKLYRNYLLDPNAGGLWQHIVMGNSGTDTGHWSTGECCRGALRGGCTC